MAKMISVFGFIALLWKVYGQLDIVTDETPLAERGACISNPCLHNGMCTVTTSGFICTCVNGYIGVNCERRADDCPRDYSMKCIQGICKLDMEGHPRCVCNEGFEGPQCSIQMDNCASNPCQNSGSCIEKVNGYDCKCPANTKGTHCQIRTEEIKKCLATCSDYYFDGKCWHNGNSPISVGWGLGEYICNSLQTCFNATKGQFDEHEYITVQLKPVQMQQTDDLIFITDRDAILYDYHFIPHILPMEANSEQAFLSCNTSNAIPLTNKPATSRLNVNDSLLSIGTQYFIADMNALYRCNFGLRLNVTVKTQKCVDPGDVVADRFCNGRGKCFTDFTRKSYECLCCEGYAGEFCQFEDPCHAKPCANGGVCEILDYGSGILNHQCKCPVGYHGKQCKKKIDYCASFPCKDNGACYFEFNDYRCECAIGFSGKNCEVNRDECASSPCRNGATCLDGLNNFKCECQPGYKGTLCEVDINECEDQPCVNSTCLDLVNNYTCACTPGHTGRNCRTLLSECASQPCVNGKCVKEEDGFSCSCGIGYTGMLCELKLDLCSHSQYCILKHVQRCIDHGDNVTCICAEGWSGSNCGVNTDECEQHRCVNGAKCVDKVNGYDCKCKKGYSGSYCEVPPEKVIPDIDISFMTDDCSKFQNPQGVHHLEVNIIVLLRSACKCPLTQEGIQVGSSKVICKDTMAGAFQMELMMDGGFEYKESIICGMKEMIDTANTPNIYHNTYIVGISDNNNLCEENNKSTVGAKAADSSSTTGVVIGIMAAFIIIIAAVVFISIKVRNSRIGKVGVTMYQCNDKDILFDNPTYVKDVSKEDSLEETIFTSEDTSMDQSESVMECPRWADSYDRSRILYDRNRSSSSGFRSNVPKGRFFDIHSPGGESSKI